MIKDIEINNFRCFDRLKVSGCKRINLISGKNNVGKTALLEAIFLNSTPTKDTIISLANLRGDSISLERELQGKTMWSNLFFQQNIDIICSINTIYQDKNFKDIDISIKHEKDFLEEIGEEIEPEKAKLLKEWLDELLKKDRFKNDNDQYLGVMIIDMSDNTITKLIALSINLEIMNNLGDTPSKYANSVYIQNSSFIPSNLRVSSARLTTEFDQARLNDRDDDVLKAFQLIDSSIVSVESFSVPEPTIYLRRQGEKRLPLSLFGDAMNRIAEIILKIINNQDGILLIDEIENGIHHSSQIALWDFLYKLADRLNVQIFATTHSLEMTEAFIKAGLDRQDSAAHFELTRHEKTNKIVAINRDLETLEYGISHHQEVRGGA
jgi:AAA15 family ATPase/GTPase